MNRNRLVHAVKISDPNFVGPVSRENKMRYGKQNNEYQSWKANQSAGKAKADARRLDDYLGVQRGKHKYIAKVRTKSGKIRYIYDDDIENGKFQIYTDKQGRVTKAVDKETGEELDKSANKALTNSRNRYLNREQKIWTNELIISTNYKLVFE